MEQKTYNSSSLPQRCTIVEVNSCLDAILTKFSKFLSRSPWFSSESKITAPTAFTPDPPIKS